MPDQYSTPNINLNDIKPITLGEVTNTNIPVVKPVQQNTGQNPVPNFEQNNNQNPNSNLSQFDTAAPLPAQPNPVQQNPVQTGSSPQIVNPVNDTSSPLNDIVQQVTSTQNQAVVNPVPPSSIDQPVNTTNTNPVVAPTQAAPNPVSEQETVKIKKQKAPKATVDLEAKYAPTPKIGIFSAYGKAFAKYGNFNGRASVAEYFKFHFIDAIILFVFGIVGAIVGNSEISKFLETVRTSNNTTAQANPYYQAPVPNETIVLGTPFIALLIVLGIYLLITFIPRSALRVRRLHDANLSGILYFWTNIAPISTLITSRPSKRAEKNFYTIK